MPLTTRCGLCGNQFPVYAQELRVRRGRVACPRCGDPVDALAGLLDEPGFSGDPRPSGGQAAAGSPRPSSPRHDRRPGAAAMVPAAAPLPGQVRSGLAAVTLAGRSTAAAPATRGWGWGWGLLALILVLTLVGQVLWWRRAEVLRDPRGFAALSTLCGYLGCALPLPRLAGALALREPSLVPDEDGGALTLRLGIANTAALPQPAPQLELELYDGQGERSASRRFTPDEYGAPAPLAPGEVRELALALSPPHTPVAGFKVRLW